MNKKLLLIAALSVVALVSLVALARSSSFALGKSEIISASEFGHRKMYRTAGDFEMILRCYVDSYAAGKCIVYRYSAEIEGTNLERKVIILFDGPLGAEYQVAYEIDSVRKKIERRSIVRL
jgi:hypothetical protein